MATPHPETRIITPVFREECIKLRTAYYCEENVWHIIKLLRERGINQNCLFSVFITNAKRCVSYQQQLAATEENEGVCLWDYHVIAAVIQQVAPRKCEVFIYDIDSKLPFPCPLAQYISMSMTSSLPNGTTYGELEAMGLRPNFRVVPYNQLMANFSSDRRHMRIQDNEAGNTTPYVSPPPETPYIKASNTSNPHTLSQFLKVKGLDTHDHLTHGSETMVNNMDFGTFLSTMEELFSFFNAATSHVSSDIFRNTPSSL